MDLGCFDGTKPFEFVPLMLGHEIAIKIEEKEPEMSHQVGDRVC